MEQKVQQYFEQMNMHASVAVDYVHGIINMSDRNGILYWLDDAQKEVAAQLAQDGFDVWHVVRTYTNDFILDAYLVVSDEVGLDTYDGVSYAYAYVNNLNEPCFSEYGDVVIAPLNGGVVRVY